MTETPGRVALVTGGTAGIGLATAQALGAAGWRVAICGRRAATVERAVAALCGAGVTATGVPADVGVEADADALVAHAEATLGPVELLVNNAGILVAKRVEELTLAEWDATMATNLRSLFLVTRRVLPGMRARRRGTIVTVASLAGRNGFVGGTAYAASKHAVLGFSRSLMLEVRGDGVRVAAVCPGSVATAMLADQPLLKADPARILRPEDVAATIVQLVELPDRALVSELDIRPTTP